MIDYGYGVKLDTIDKVADDARGWRNEPEIYDWCRQVGLIDEKHHEGWLNSVMGSQRDQMFSIVAGKNYVGVCGLTSISFIHRTAELSYYCAVSHQQEVGRDFGKSVLKTLCAYAFNGLGMNRVWGDSFEGNIVALSNLSDLGFKRDGILRQSYYKNGKYINSVVQSLLRSEYEEVKNGW